MSPKSWKFMRVILYSFINWLSAQTALCWYHSVKQPLPLGSSDITKTQNINGYTEYSMTSEILEICTVYRKVRCVFVCVSGKSSCVLKQINKDPMPTKPCFSPTVKVPGGIGPNGRLSSPAFSLLFIFLKTAHPLFSSLLFLPLYH